MKKSYKIFIAFAVIAVLAVTYRAPIVEAKIQAVKQLLIDLANGNVSVQASSTATGAVETAMLESGLQPSHVVKLSGKVMWLGTAASANYAIPGALSTDLITASISSIPSEAAYLAKADVFSNNSAIFTLSAANTSTDAEITYQITRAAP